MWLDLQGLALADWALCGRVYRAFGAVRRRASGSRSWSSASRTGEHLQLERPVYLTGIVAKHVERSQLLASVLPHRINQLQFYHPECRNFMPDQAVADKDMAAPSRRPPDFAPAPETAAFLKRALSPRWPTFTPPQWPNFAPPLTRQSDHVSNCAGYRSPTAPGAFSPRCAMSLGDLDTPVSQQN